MVCHDLLTSKIVTKMYPSIDHVRPLVIYGKDMSRANPTYTSFLVRLWHEQPVSFASQVRGREWLAQIEHIPGGEKEYFTSLEDLFVYIRTQLSDIAENEKKSTD